MNRLQTILNALRSLWNGMKLTFGYLIRPSTVVTQQYPENKDTLRMFDRYRAQLLMIYNQEGHHHCTGCQMCEEACPNASVRVLTRKNPLNGKKELDRYTWRLDSCTFCNACVQVCPFNAIRFGGDFESSVYDRRLLIYTLNRYAGPTAKDLSKIESPEERQKQMDSRRPFDSVEEQS